MLEKILAVIAGTSYVGAIYYGRRPEIIRRDRNDPRVIANRLKRISMVCLFWLLFTPMTVPMTLAGAIRLLGILPGFTQNHSLWTDVVQVVSAIRTIGALYLGTIYAYFYHSRCDMATFIDDIYINFFTLQGYRDHVFAPATEEFVYRLVVLTYLAQSLPVLIYASPLLFGLAHVHHGLEMKRANPKMPWLIVIFQTLFQLAYTTVFGLLATYMFRKYNHNVWTTVALHFMCNLLQFPPAGIDGPLYANVVYYVLSVFGVVRFFVLLKKQ